MPLQKGNSYVFKLNVQFEIAQRLLGRGENFSISNFCDSKKLVVGIKEWFFVFVCLFVCFLLPFALGKSMCFKV